MNEGEMTFGSLAHLNAVETAWSKGKNDLVAAWWRNDLTVLETMGGKGTTRLGRLHLALDEISDDLLPHVIMVGHAGFDSMQSLARRDKNPLRSIQSVRDMAQIAPQMAVIYSHPRIKQAAETLYPDPGRQHENYRHIQRWGASLYLNRLARMTGDPDVAKLAYYSMKNLVDDLTNINPTHQFYGLTIMQQMDAARAIRHFNPGASRYVRVPSRAEVRSTFADVSRLPGYADHNKKALAKWHGGESFRAGDLLGWLQAIAFLSTDATGPHLSLGNAFVETLTSAAGMMADYIHRVTGGRGWYVHHSQEYSASLNTLALLQSS